jgi:hypothetical protein
MHLAHTITPGGPETEYLILAGAMLILGVVFFAMKNVKPIVAVILIIGAIAVGAGAFAFRPDGASGTGVELSLISPQSGETVDAGEPVQLQVQLQGGAMAGQESDGEVPGHLHVFVDGKTVDMPTSLTPEVKLPPGKHELAVEFVDSSHLSFSPPIRAQVQLKAR